MISGAIIMPLVIHFVSFGKIRAIVTWKLLDTFVSVFLAVLWFNAFSGFMHAWLDPKTPSPAFMALIGLAEFVVLYVGVIVLSFMLKQRRLVMGAFVAIGAHYIAFAGVHSTG